MRERRPSCCKLVAAATSSMCRASREFASHHVEQSLYPEWVGIEQVRRFEFDGDALLLTAEAGTLTACLAWRRAK